MKLKSKPRPAIPPLSTSNIAIISFGSACFLVGAFAIIILFGEDVTTYIREPAAIFEYMPLTGAISTLGVGILLSASAICAFVSAHAQKESGLLLWIGLFGSIMAADDYFMLHEAILPALGIPELIVLMIYGIFALSIFFKYRTSISGRTHLGFYVALIFLAASAAVDIMMPYSYVVLEDSLKFMGLVVWSAYWIARAHQSLATATPYERRRSAEDEQIDQESR